MAHQTMKLTQLPTNTRMTGSFFEVGFESG